MFLLSTGVGAVVGLMQHGARKEAEEQRDQARLDKAETDKRLQATEQQIQTLKDDLGRALARSTPSHVEVPKVEIPEKIKPVAPRPPSDWRWIWDPAKPKPPKGKTEPGPVVKKSNEPETPPLPKKRNPSETDYDEWFGELAGLNFAERWVRYKRLNDDDFVKKAGKNVDSFELILKDLPGKDLEKKSEQKVFWIKSASFREAPKEANYTIIARYLSGTQSGRGKGGTPTYVPEKGQRIMEIKPPIKIKHVVNPSADLLERQFYYVEQADFPFEVSDDANLIFVVEKNVPTQPSECLLMWLRKKQKS